MEIKDLPDPRDRDNCLRAQRAESMHEFRMRDDYNSRVVSEQRVKDFDKLSDTEFNGRVDEGE